MCAKLGSYCYSTSYSGLSYPPLGEDYKQVLVPPLLLVYSSSSRYQAVMTPSVFYCPALSEAP